MPSYGINTSATLHRKSEELLLMSSRLKATGAEFCRLSRNSINRSKNNAYFDGYGVVPNATVKGAEESSREISETESRPEMTLMMLSKLQMESKG